MEQENFEKLMAEIQKSKTDVEKHLAATVADLKREVSTAQEKTSLDISWRIACSSYQFKKKKSHEHQYMFNAELKDAFSAVKTELDRVDAATLEDQASIRRAKLQLDEGLKSLATRQKFIKIADRSEFGWATVKFYQSDPLASDSEDEKDLGRARRRPVRKRRDSQQSVERGSSRPV